MADVASYCAANCPQNGQRWQRIEYTGSAPLPGGCTWQAYRVTEYIDGYNVSGYGELKIVQYGNNKLRITTFNLMQIMLNTFHM